MKIDLYTKIVLTIIAVCLVCLVLNSGEIRFVTQAHAQPAALQTGGVVDVNIVSIDRKQADCKTTTLMTRRPNDLTFLSWSSGVRTAKKG